MLRRFGMLVFVEESLPLPTLVPPLGKKVLEVRVLGDPVGV
jgi:hypothetical protein